MDEKADLWAAFQVALDQMTDPHTPPTARAKARRQVRSLGRKLARYRQRKEMV